MFCCFYTWSDAQTLSKYSVIQAADLTSLSLLFFSFESKVWWSLLYSNINSIPTVRDIRAPGLKSTLVLWGRESCTSCAPVSDTQLFTDLSVFMRMSRRDNNTKLIVNGPTDCFSQWHLKSLIFNLYVVIVLSTEKYEEVSISYFGLGLEGKCFVWVSKKKNLNIKINLSAFLMYEYKSLKYNTVIPQHPKTNPLFWQDVCLHLLPVSTLTMKTKQRCKDDWHILRMIIKQIKNR